MAGRIEPLQESQIPALSEFLRSGFCRSGSYCGFAQPEVLKWKYFDERSPWNIPRSFVVTDQNRIIAHAGIFTTELVSPNTTPVRAVHIVDWLSSEESASFGALLMLRAFNIAPVTYALGCTEAAARVLVRAGYELISAVPLYHRVLNRTNPRVWRQLHGTPTLARAIGMASFDGIQSFRPSRQSQKLTIRPVTVFGEEVNEVLSRTRAHQIFTSRSPEILNHYLRFPLKTFTGYLIEDQRVRGFGLVNVVNKPKVKITRIVDCFLDCDDFALWADAVSLLNQEVRKLKPDLVSVYGSTEPFAEALRANGFFRRGRTPFYLRDPKKLIPRNYPFHLTHLEADLSFI